MHRLSPAPAGLPFNCSWAHQQTEMKSRAKRTALFLEADEAQQLGKRSPDPI